MWHLSSPYLLASHAQHLDLLYLSQQPFSLIMIYSLGKLRHRGSTHMPAVDSMRWCASVSHFPLPVCPSWILMYCIGDPYSSAQSALAHTPLYFPALPRTRSCSLRAPLVPQVHPIGSTYEKNPRHAGLFTACPHHHNAPFNLSGRDHPQYISDFAFTSHIRIPNGPTADCISNKDQHLRVRTMHSRIVHERVEGTKFIVFCVASGVTAPPLSTMRISRVHDWLIVIWDLDSDAAQSDDADRLPVLQVHPADLQSLRASCLGALSIVVESDVLYSVTPRFLLKFSSVNSGAIFAAGPGPISMRVPLSSHNNMIRKITRRRNRTKMALFERNLE
ncbi:hypothetical protein EDB83DRAFT_2314076 [Lactarius deliciosus]|nr:hypothetical protein EDB83DRAFT_2314076 [Lactarius deliciosus]